MADRTRFKALDESVCHLQGRLIDQQLPFEDRFDRTVKHLETLEAKLERTLLLVTETLNHRPNFPPELSANPLPGFAPPANPILSPPIIPQQPFPGQNIFPPCTPPIDFPKFDGTKPLDWIFKAERYFELYNTPPYHRLLLAYIHMEGPALPWSQLNYKTLQFHSWEDFAHNLEVTFGPSAYEDPQETLVKLTQTSTVTEYRQRFDALASRISGVSPSFLISCFISGLRSDIRYEVKAFRPSSFAEAIGLARLQEAKLAERHGSNRWQPTPQATAINTTSTEGVPKAPPSNPKQSQNFRRLSLGEMQQKRQLGLCFTCDEKWTSNHHCKNRPQLFLIDCTDDDSLEPPLDQEQTLDSQAVRALHHPALNGQWYHYGTSTSDINAHCPKTI